MKTLNQITDAVKGCIPGQEAIEKYIPSKEAAVRYGAILATGVVMAAYGSGCIYAESAGKNYGSYGEGPPSLNPVTRWKHFLRDI